MSRIFSLVIIVGVSALVFSGKISAQDNSLLADSVAQFSGTQGKDGWFYGYYNQSQDPDALYQITDFQELPLYSPGTIWEGQIWELELGTGPPWTALGNEWGHPNGPPHGETHWAVRRWKSTFGGEVQITGESGKMWFGMGGGDGTEVAILVDGSEVFSRAVPADDDGRTPFSVSATLNVNSLLDFVIRPQSTDDYDSTAFYVRISAVQIINQPPQITHTPITQAKKGKEILFSMQVTDDQNQLKTLVIFARVAGERDFTPYPIGVSPGQTMYDKGISGLTDTLAGVEYYIEATDKQGLVGYHRSDDGAHFICVTDPNKKTPVIIIPGIMGSELYDESTEPDEKIWIDWDAVKNIRNDTFLLRLLLQRDGITPDARDRCSGDFRFTCTTFLECPQLPPSTCVPGGRNIRVGSYLDIGPFTSYRNLGEYLIKNGYEDKKNLFFFAYDWRLDIKDIAGALRKIIEFLTPNCGDRINIIAHSMGGMVVSSYLQQNPNNHRTEKIISLGTPHYGSPQAYAALKGYKPLIKWMAEQEFWDEWTEIWNWVELNTITFVSQNFPGCYQLLPRFDFITRDGTKEPFNKSFENLSNQNLVARAENFHDLLNSPHPRDVEYYSIVGTGLKTLSGFKIDNSCVKLEIDLDGDGTVPLNSSTAFDLAQNFYVREEHQNLPKNIIVQEKILNILNGNPNFPVDGIGSNPIRGQKARKYRKCSPITLKITDTEGNVTGQDDDGHIKDNIPESSHFIFEENEAGYIPYDGEYTVDIHGTGAGVFTLTFEKVEDNQLITQAIEYPNIPVTDTSRGTIILTPDSEAPELSYDVDGNGTTDFKIMPGENPPAELQQMFVEPGDVNKDRRIDISDAISILGHLFLGNNISCINAGDTNKDNTIDISDPIYLLEFLFLGTEKKPSGLAFCPGE